MDLVAFLRLGASVMLSAVPSAAPARFTPNLSPEDIKTTLFAMWPVSEGGVVCCCATAAQHRHATSNAIRVFMLPIVARKARVQHRNSLRD